jgi:hypothetical protein
MLEFSREEVVYVLRVTRGKHLSQCSRAWGRRGKQLEEEAETKQEQARVDDGIERVNLVTVARGLKAGEDYSVSAALALCNYMVRTELKGAGLVWLVDDLRVVRTLRYSAWCFAKAAHAGPAVLMVESAGALYTNRKPPCIRRQDYNANRIPGRRRKRPALGAQPA